MNRQTLTVLGSTGSIGVNTLDVVSRHNDKFQLFALTADSNVSLLAQQCRQFKPAYAVMNNALAAKSLGRELAEAGCTTEVLSGKEALCEVAKADEVDTVMAAIVGSAGLLPTLAAVIAGKKVLLANKESLVMAGGLFMAAVRDHHAQLLPIDSEHNAIYQCLPATAKTGVKTKGIRKILLTGSGGPFRTWSTEAIASATVQQACNHPNWSMGQKISVDSATLMNKGLEYIEARWLFDVDPELIQVVIHPQSVVHSMVEYIDGSVMAQLGNPDMRTPIAHALAWPERIDIKTNSLDLIAMKDLQFEAPDLKRFPALTLAFEAASKPMGAATVLNAANEVAVAGFLQQRLSFGNIHRLISEVMSAADYPEPDTIDAVLELDFYARQLAHKLSQTKMSA